MVKITAGSAANLWLRLMEFPEVGDVMPGHEHPHDHFTLLAHGSLRVTVNGVSSDHKAPNLIFIAKNLVHDIVALEPGSVACCIHAIRAADSQDIVEPQMVPTGAWETMQDLLGVR
jgi:quercetin dioxygenase-like cupin family protein